MSNRKPDSAKKFTDSRADAGIMSLQHQAWLALVFVLLVLVTPGPVIDIIRILLSLPASQPVASDFPVDKILHFVMFAVCSFLSFRAWSHAVRRIYLFAGLLFFAAVTEILQMLVPGRSGDLSDFLADTAGVMIGLWWFNGVRSAVTDDKKNPT